MLILILLGSVQKIRAQEYASQEYYLIDSLDLEKASKSDQELIDSVLFVYYLCETDTCRVRNIVIIAEECWDAAIWPKYNQWILDYTEERINAPVTDDASKRILEKAYAGALNNVGYLHNVQGDQTRALEFYKRGLEIQERLNDKEGMALTLINIGHIFNDKGMFPETLERFYASLELMEETNNEWGISVVLNAIGYIYYSKDQLEKAQEYYLRSLKIRRSIDDDYGIATVLNNLALVYVDQGLFKDAIDYFEQAMAIEEKIGDKSGVAIAMENIGDVYLKQQSYDRALEYYNESLLLHNETDYLKGISSVHASIAEAEILKNNWFNALQHARKSYKAAKQNQFVQGIQIAVKLLYKIEKHNGNWRQALVHHEELLLLSDSLENKENLTELLTAQFKYDLLRQSISDSIKLAEKIKLKDLELDNLNVVNDKKQSEQYVLIIAIMLLVCVVVFLFVLSQTVRRKNKNILKQKHLLSLSQSKFYGVLNNSIDAIITTDLENNITSANKSAAHLLGYDNDELLGQSVQILYANNSEYEQISNEITLNGRFSGNVHNITKDGRKIICKLSANILTDAKGTIIGSMGISKDISQEVELQTEYEQLINHASDVIYGADYSGRITYINGTVKSVLGFNEDEIQGKLFDELIDPEHRDMVKNHYLEHFQDRLQQSYLEFKIKTKQQGSIWVGQRVSTKFNTFDSERIDGFYGILRDINTRKLAELELKKSDQRYSDLFNNSGDLIQSIDHNGFFVYVNDTWKRKLEYSDENIKTLNIFDIIHPNSQDHFKHLFNNIRNKKLSEESVLYDIITKTGETITVEDTIRVNFLSDDKFQIQSFLRDVTDQKKAERKLAQKEKTLRQITETINDVFYLYNFVNNKFDYVSPNCADVLGADESFFYSNSSYSESYILQEDKAIMREAQEELMAGNSYNIDYRIMVDRNSKKIKWINEKSFPIKNNDGEVIAGSGICRDISDLKRANETIHKQNLEIGSSILYAKTIQDSVLPDDSAFQSIFPDSFVYYEPKDVVSGDFYIVDNITTKDNKVLPVFLVGDCTGHGVPGAVLSLMCNVLIREALIKPEIQAPSEVLAYVRLKLSELFGKGVRSYVRDGMDAALCILNEDRTVVHYAGANNPCVLIRDHKIIEYKGDRQHIGYSDNPQPFTNHEIEVQKGDVLIIFSDGYIDQFGGTSGKKFMKKKFLEILLENSEIPMPEVGQILKKRLNEWMIGFEQLDDITVLGVRI